MFRIAIALCSLLFLVACNPTATDEKMKPSRASKPSNVRMVKAEPGLKSEVESIVRRFSDDSSARVSITKVDGEIVCGVMTSGGRKTDFYVDLVDEEAMFADGIMKSAVVAAC